MTASTTDRVMSTVASVLLTTTVSWTRAHRQLDVENFGAADFENDSLAASVRKAGRGNHDVDRARRDVGNDEGAVRPCRGFSRDRGVLAGHRDACRGNGRALRVEHAAPQRGGRHLAEDEARAKASRTNIERDPTSTPHEDPTSGAVFAGDSAA